VSAPSLDEWIALIARFVDRSVPAERGSLDRYITWLATHIQISTHTMT
jgi:hypothetical protein